MTGNLEDTIKQNAAGPRKASGDAGSMEQHSLADQIAADKYLAGKAAMAGRTLGLRKVKIIPPGAV